MSNTATTTNRRATVVGLGLIGGSICVALRERGWLVSGDDQDPQRATEALERGLISAAGIDAESQVTFVAVPVTAISLQVQRALDATNGIVTDVGSVKAVVTRTITDPRFIGGHPMAGSELEGLDGADGELFTGLCGFSHRLPQPQMQHSPRWQISSMILGQKSLVLIPCATMSWLPL